MLPKTRKYLRGFENELYKFIEEHKSEFLAYEYRSLNEAFRLIICADTHLFHLGLSHSQAKQLEDVSERI